MSGVPPARNRPGDDITLAQLCQVAGREMLRAARAGKPPNEAVVEFEREVEVEDPPVRHILGRTHKVRVRVTVRAISLLFGTPDGKSVKRIG